MGAAPSTPSALPLLPAQVAQPEAACITDRPCPLLACSFLPDNVSIIGYARSPLTDQQLRDKLRPRLEGSDKERDAFLQHCTYVQGAPAGQLLQRTCGVCACVVGAGHASQAGGVAQACCPSRLGAPAP